MLHNYNSGGTHNLFIAELTSAFTGISEIMDTPLGIRLFPNPASETLNIQLISSVPEIRITDLVGRVIGTKPVQSNTTITVDIRDLPPGVYLLHGGINGFAKFIKAD